MNLRRVVDFAAYTLICLGVAAIVIWSADRGVPREIVEKWGPLWAVTILLFGSVLVNRRHLASRVSFWAVLVGFLAVHLLVMVTLLQSVDDWKPIWWAPLFPIEMVAIDMVLMFVGLDPYGSRRQRPKKAS